MKPLSIETKMKRSVAGQMFASGEFSDCTRKCEGLAFRVHRVVICLQSPIFRSAFEGGFKEASTREYFIEDFDCKTVERMISFMYTADYPDLDEGLNQVEYEKRPAQLIEHTGTTADLIDVKKDIKITISQKNDGLPITNTLSAITLESSPLLNNTKVYIIADYFDLPELKDLARKKYGIRVLEDWKTPAFSASLKVLYDNTSEADDKLRNLCARTAGEHIRELADRKEFERICREDGNIVFDALKVALTYQKPPPNIFCAQCRNRRATMQRQRGTTFPWYCNYCVG